MKRSNYKILLPAFSLTLSLFSSMQASAEGGHGSGNGGGAQYCAQPRASQLKFEAYDLYEAKNPIDLSRKVLFDELDPSLTKKAYLEKALLKIEASHQAKLANALRRALSYLNANVQDSKGKELFIVSDVHSLMHDRNCSYYQLVNWIDQAQDLKEFGLTAETILRDEEAYQQMDALNQAANDLHEAAYKIRRSFGLGDDSGSLQIRKFVAQVFGKGEIDSALFQQISLYSETLIDIGSVHVGSDSESTEQRQKIFFLEKTCSKNDFKASTRITFWNSGSTPMKSAIYQRVTDALGTREQKSVNNFGPLFGWMAGYSEKPDSEVSNQILRTRLTQHYGNDDAPYLYGASLTRAASVQSKLEMGKLKVIIESCGEKFEEEFTVPVSENPRHNRSWTSISVSVLAPQF